MNGPGDGEVDIIVLDQLVFFLLFCLRSLSFLQARDALRIDINRESLSFSHLSGEEAIRPQYRAVFCSKWAFPFSVEGRWMTGQKRLHRDALLMIIDYKILIIFRVYRGLGIAV